MLKYYKIAGLTVAMDTFGRTAKQAEPYCCSQEGAADIVIVSKPELLNDRFPGISDDDAEYLATCGCFYKELLNFSGFRFHSSAVVMDDKAYLFTADSGTGKSTHTGLWLQQFGDRAFVLNDDKPALRLEDGIWYAYGTPWSGKHDISVNTRVPVAGIAYLERGLENRIQPFAAQEAVLTILRQCNRPKAPEYRIKLLELLDKLITQVPIWKLQCNMDPEAAIVSYEGMSGEKWRN